SCLSTRAVPTSLRHRATSVVLEPPKNTPSFVIDQKNRSYKHQYSNIYFVRLRLLKDTVCQAAEARWKNIDGSKLCYIVGTVYMEMPLKPNVLEDIARDRSLPTLPPQRKICSEDDEIMLEDESGRIQLVGEHVKDARLVTGIVVAVLGAETPSGEFEVVSVCSAGMPEHTPVEDDDQDVDMDVDPSSSHRMSVEDKQPQDEWIGVISGLDIGSEATASEASIQLLVEYLTGEQGGVTDEQTASCISRLIIAGNSLAPIEPTELNEDKKSRYGQETSTFSPHPLKTLSSHLLDVGRAMPVHILPGETDPAGAILPQQALPRRMFGDVSNFDSFRCETNPTYVRVGTTNTSRRRVVRDILINSGQPLNDLFKYLPSPPHTRLSILESTLRWRHMAPTAPDTLWCHPYFTADPFMLQTCPHICIVGNQKRFATKMVSANADQARAKSKGGDEEDQARCRIVMVPSFSQTGVLVLINLRTLGVKTVKFATQNMTGGSSMITDEPKGMSCRRIGALQ
ncbi:hypothetical protein FISHEDRAFT_38252, partial [Fistulina hepatica ATCC 64428]